MSKSLTTEIQLKNKYGLHARPAAILVKTASLFEAEISVEKDGEKVNGKSLIGLLMLAAEYGSKLKITASGPDAYTAIEELEKLFTSNKDFLEE